MEPLIFVEVALTKGIASSTIFSSISNCQAGLAGISFGNSLIKRVVNDLTAELPGLSTFSTLSPMPLFSRWLLEQGCLLRETYNGRFG